MDIIQMSISASILIIAIVIIRSLALHRLPKMTFLVLWGVVVLRLLVPLSIPSRFSIYTGLDMLKSSFAEKTPIPSMMGTTVIPNMANISGAGQPVSVDVSVTPFITPLEIAWLVGMCVCMLFFIVAYVKCVRQFKMSLPIENDFISLWLRESSLRRSVQIRQSDCITTPLTYGIFRPVVLLPKNTDWTDETKLRYVLAHEYTHIHRFDTLTKLVLTVAVCVHWFNPLVWVMYVLANRDIELSCDETVVRSFGETIKSAYALTLIGLEEKKSRIIPLVNYFGKNAIEERIVSIMKIKKTSLVGMTLALALVVSTITVFATSANAYTSDAYVTLTEDNVQIVHPFGKISYDAGFEHGGISIIGENISYVKFTAEIGELSFFDSGAFRQMKLPEQGKNQNGIIKLYKIEKDSSLIQRGKEVTKTFNEDLGTKSFDVNWTPWYAIDTLSEDKSVDFASLPSDMITIEVHYKNGETIAKQLRLSFNNDGNLISEIITN